jgi:hypothetical protein
MSPFYDNMIKTWQLGRPGSHALPLRRKIINNPEAFTCKVDITCLKFHKANAGEQAADFQKFDSTKQ